MDYCYSYFYNSSTNFEPKKLACEAGFVDEGGSAVPLPEELTKMFKPLECELCGVVVTSEVTAYTHYEGKVHMKSVNAFMKEQYNIYGSMQKIKVEFTPHQCEVCKCDLSSLIQAQQHYSGKVHKKNLRKINYDPQAAMAMPPDISIDGLGSDLLKDLPPPPPPPVLSDFICEICNVTTNTEYQLIVHKNGAKHKRKVKKLKESFGDFGTDGFGYFKGDMPLENYVEGQTYASTEPIVTDYLPLSNEPLQFNNINNICNPQNNVDLNQSMPNQYNEDEEDKTVPLCIKWFKDKKEALPPRPLEDAWVETFNKTLEETKTEAHSTVISLSQSNPMIPAQEESNYSTSSTPSVSDIRTYEISPELADLPQFSVAAVLPQLLAPPNPPIGLMSSALFDISDETVSQNVETSSLEPPRIRFKGPIVQPDKGSSEISMDQVSDKDHINEQEISDLNADSTSSSNSDKTIERAKTISNEFTSTQNNLNVKSSNDELSCKPVISEVRTEKEQNKGTFITSNWECSQVKSLDNENDLKKKRSLNFLFGFKKGLSKKVPDINKNTGNLQGTSGTKVGDRRDLKDKIDLCKEIAKDKSETGYGQIILNKECNEQELLNNFLRKKPCDLKEGGVQKRCPEKKDEESKYSKDKSYSKYRKDKHEKDSYDYYRYSPDYRKGSRDYRKDSPDNRKGSRDNRKDSPEYRKGSRDYRKDSRDYDKDSSEYRKESRDYRKDSPDYRKGSRDYRKDSPDYRRDSRDHRKDSPEYRKDSRDHRKDYSDHHRSKNSHKRHREHRKHKDDYDSYSDSDDEDYQRVKKKHRDSSRKDKESHKNKKPSLAQPFVHKTNTKHSIIDYLAPASECDSNDIAMYRVPSGSYYCSRCDYESKSSFEFTNHIHGRDHKEKKKNNIK